MLNSDQIFLLISIIFCILQIDQSSFGLSREFLIKGVEDKIVKAYYEYMVDTAVIYGADKKVAEVELLEALEFEIALANVRICFFFINQQNLLKFIFS